MSQTSIHKKTIKVKSQNREKKINSETTSTHLRGKILDEESHNHQRFYFPVVMKDRYYMSKSL